MPLEWGSIWGHLLEVQALPAFPTDHCLHALPEVRQIQVVQGLRHSLAFQDYLALQKIREVLAGKKRICLGVNKKSLNERQKEWMKGGKKLDWKIAKGTGRTRSKRRPKKRVSKGRKAGNKEERKKKRKEDRKMEKKLRSIGNSWEARSLAERKGRIWRVKTNFSTKERK